MTTDFERRSIDAMRQREALRNPAPVRADLLARARAATTERDAATDGVVGRLLAAQTRLDTAVADARLALQRHVDSGDVRPTMDARELAQALGALVRAVDPHPTPRRAPAAPHRAPTPTRVRYVDGVCGTIAAGAEPDVVMGEPYWPVTWDDGTAGSAHDDELTVIL